MHRLPLLVMALQRWVRPVGALRLERHAFLVERAFRLVDLALPFLDLHPFLDFLDFFDFFDFDFLHFLDLRLGGGS